MGLLVWFCILEQVGTIDVQLVLLGVGDSVSLMIWIVCLLVFFHHGDIYAYFEVTIFHH